MLAALPDAEMVMLLVWCPGGRLDALIRWLLMVCMLLVLVAVACLLPLRLMLLVCLRLGWLVLADLACSLALLTPLCLLCSG